MGAILSLRGQPHLVFVVIDRRALAPTDRHNNRSGERAQGKQGPFRAVRGGTFRVTFDSEGVLVVGIA